MRDENCTFCKIANKEIKSYKIYQGKEFIAFMDIYPPTFDDKITMPTVIIATREHYGSNIFEDASEKILLKAIKLARKIARAMQIALKPERVCLVTEGLEINHFHIKLYAVYKEYYPGYLSSMKGPENKETQADKKWLKQTAKKVRIALKEIKKSNKSKD
ncbi:MAG: HIT family protein [Candidatus Woesearchaeota archaeon]